MKNINLYLLIVCLLFIFSCQTQSTPPNLASKPEAATSPDTSQILLPSGPAANATQPDKNKILLPSGPAANVNTKPEENKILLPSGPAANILLPSGPAAGFTAPEDKFTIPPRGFTFPPRGFTYPPRGFSALTGKILLPSGPAAKILLPSGPAAGILLPSGPAAGILLPSGPAAGFTITQNRDEQQVTIKINGQFFTLLIQNEETLPDGSKRVQFFLPQLPLNASGNEAALYLPGAEHPTLMASLNQQQESSFNNQNFSIKSTTLALLKRKNPGLTHFDLDNQSDETNKVLNELKAIFANKVDLNTQKEDKLNQQISQSVNNIPVLNRRPERIALKLPSPLLILKDKSLQLDAEVFFSDNTTSQNLLWSSSNPAVAMVDSEERKIVTFEAGLTTLTAYLPNDSLSQTLQIRVVTEEELKTAKILEPEKPKLSLLKPSSGQSFTLGSTVKIEASLSSLPEDFHDILFRAGNTVLGESKTAPYTVNWQTENVAKGEHTITAKVRNPQGETILNTEEVTITIFTSSGTIAPEIIVPTPSAPASPPPVNIIYVNGAATGDNNGTNWSNAYQDLQSALTAATSGKDIWVAAGTYKPTTGADRTATFTLKNGVNIYGGFSGVETTQAQRNFSTNLTILDGDLNGDDVGITNNGENVYHVVTGASGGTLNGFIVRGGNANSTGNNALGGGLLENGTSSNILNTTFKENNALTGGSAMAAISNASPTLTSCTFDSNVSADGTILAQNTATPTLIQLTVQNNTSSGGSGGITTKNSATVTISSSTFSGNIASSLNGGGISVEDLSTVSIEDSSFSSNSATLANGGAVHCEGTSSILNIRNTLFNNNTATGDGGAINVTGSCLATVERAIIHGSTAANGAGIQASGMSLLALISSVITGNTATTSGGGINHTSIAPMAVDFSTIQGNTATASGGGISMINGGAATMTIDNSIVYGNQSPGSGNQLQLDGAAMGVTVSFSNIEGSGGATIGTCPGACGGQIDGTIAAVTNGTNNLDTDPLFINTGDIDGADNVIYTADDGLALTNASPSKDSANLITVVLKDVLGVSRANGIAPDMGAYEK